MTLKVNSQRILDVYIKQKTKNARKAYMEVHPTASIATASSRMTDLLKKPEAQVYLQEHVTKATQRIVGLVDSEKEEIALRASQDIIDRNMGKAVQTVIQSKNGVTLNIDLSGSTVNVQPAKLS